MCKDDYLSNPEKQFFQKTRFRSPLFRFYGFKKKLFSYSAKHELRNDDNMLRYKEKARDDAFYIYSMSSRAFSLLTPLNQVIPHKSRSDSGVMQCGIYFKITTS